MNFELQPNIENELVKIQPLQKSDFEALYKVASDPLIWEQHPNQDRYKKDVFINFFTGAIESGGAFLVYDVKSGEPIGSSRYYGYDGDKKNVSIGYTFLARDHWGTTYNRALKSLMMDHAFRFVDSVIFHIGAGNIRSQKSIVKLGAQKIGELEMEYYGERMKLNFVYEIEKKDWMKVKDE
ncbi:MAG: GNAT family N-acetyltransferase [Ignavibacteria bacterium]